MIGNPYEKALDIHLEKSKNIDIPGTAEGKQEDVSLDIDPVNLSPEKVDLGFLGKAEEMEVLSEELEDIDEAEIYCLPLPGMIKESKDKIDELKMNKVVETGEELEVTKMRIRKLQEDCKDFQEDLIHKNYLQSTNPTDWANKAKGVYN